MLFYSNKILRSDLKCWESFIKVLNTKCHLWKTIKFFATFATSGMTWIPLDPTPTTATTLFCNLMVWSHFAVWITGPLKLQNSSGIFLFRRIPVPSILCYWNFIKLYTIVVFLNLYSHDIEIFLILNSRIQILISHIPQLFNFLKPYLNDLVIETDFIIKLILCANILQIFQNFWLCRICVTPIYLDKI